MNTELASPVSGRVPVSDSAPPEYTPATRLRFTRVDDADLDGVRPAASLYAVVNAARAARPRRPRA